MSTTTQRSQIISHQGVVKQILLSSLLSHPNAQRDVISSHVNTLAKNFDWGLFGVPIGTHKAEGAKTYYVCDGQHRVLAAKKCYPEGIDEAGNPIYITVLIVEKDPCEIFVGCNGGDVGPKTRKAVSPNQIFKAKLECDCETEVKITSILAKNHITIQFEKGGPQVGSTKSPAAFKEMFEKLSDVTEFKKCVNILSKNFSRPNSKYVEQKALTSDFIQPFARFFSSLTNNERSKVQNMLNDLNTSASDIWHMACSKHPTSRYAQKDFVESFLKRKLVEFLV